MNSLKTKRIASDIARNVSDILANEARDKLLKTITITGCEVSKDLGFCKVYFTALSDLPKEELTKELNEAAPFVRGQISAKMTLRHTPEIRFIYDTSIAYGEKIEKIIQGLNEQ